MKIGIPKEVKNNENRVGLPPNGVSALVDNGHTVYVETDAQVSAHSSQTTTTQMRAQPSSIVQQRHGTLRWSSKSKSRSLRNMSSSQKD